MNRLRKIALGFAGVFILYISVLFVYGWWSDWQPAPGAQAIDPDGHSSIIECDRDTLRLSIWNVGFGGNGAESDFFFDDEGIWYSGSSMTRTPRPFVEKNIAGALEFLRTTASDIFLLQEVDKKSERSYDIPQYDQYLRTLPSFSAAFAENYRCDRVPIPLLEPWNAYGRVLSGLATFSRFEPRETQRIQLPGHYPMPDRIFQLDRCLLLTRYTTRKGRELVVINVHNAAYDPKGRIRALQTAFLKELALEEYKKGNYVLIGGDWNQCPPWFRFDTFRPGDAQGFLEENIREDYFPENWVYAYDPGVPTNRKLRDPYEKGKTFETLIDFYLLSPNLKIISVKTQDQGFQFSDHQPVHLTVQLQ